MLMKLINQLLRWIIGGLFIFSGMIKVNDPIGTAIKLEEYFDVFSESFSSIFQIFIPYALPIAVVLVVAEVVLGVALIVKFKTRTVLWALWGMILFFTFLTFYSAYFNKVTDCGCFGDAIKLTPWESFTKDVVLLVLIGILLLQRKRFHNKALKIPKFTVIAATLFSIFIAISAIRHLPFIDFRPYKIGDNIQKNMEVQGEPDFYYRYLKDGEEIVAKEYITDEGYELLGGFDKNAEKNQPKITDYNISDDEGNDITLTTFEGNKLIIIIEKTGKTNLESYPTINNLLNSLEGKVEQLIFTADMSNFEEFRHEVQLATPYYSADATVLKAMIRSNPGIILLQDGTVKGKWHYNDLPTADEVMEKLN
ncbi:MAG: BT_3928 family protein [Flammeovirgaceae bacterium]